MKKLFILPVVALFAAACNPQIDSNSTADSLTKDTADAPKPGNMNQKLDTPSGRDVRDTGSVLTDSTIKQ